jgi:hypothetical protein
MIVKSSFDFRIILDCQEMDLLRRIQRLPDDFVVVSLDLNLHAPAANNSRRAATNGNAPGRVRGAQWARVSQ